MRFFLPGTESINDAESNYQNIVKFVTEQMGPLRPERYYAIFYKHSGKECVAKVGHTEPLTGEMVVAIFRKERESGPFLICTPNRGVIRGDPVLASSVGTRAIHFEEA